MEVEIKPKKFPKGFLWGSATSAYQVEGGNKNSDWEHWKVKAGRACDHYHRFEEDFDLAQSLNQNAHRFSIEWARIEPEKGEFDEQEVEHYRKVIKALRQRGIRPLVTLHHFTNPLWVAERGGWENPSTVGHFESYVRYIVTQLADLCDFWITINEPYIILSAGYLWGNWPPEKRNPLAAFKAEKNLMRAHRGAYQIIHTIQPKARVGIAHSLASIRLPLRTWYSSFWERAIVDRAGPQDFIGVNYYRSTSPITFKPFGFRSLPRSDTGWEIYPEGLYRILHDLKKFNLPIYITENGIADAKDEKRANFISDHLVSVWRALHPPSPRLRGDELRSLDEVAQEGVDVKGYFYWSLLDNFEWAWGFGPRFGLIEVDYETMKRTIRSSAQIYARIAEKNTLE